MLSTCVGRLISLLALTGVSLPIAAFPAEPTPPRYVVHNLAPGQAPGRISDAGEIAGSLYVTEGPLTRPHAAVRRSNGVWEGLGVLEDDTSSGGYGINTAGLVVGFSSKPFGLSNTRYRAIQVENGVMTAVAGLAADAVAYAVNDIGQACGKMGPDTPDFRKPWHAFIAEGAVVTDLHDELTTALGYEPLETVASNINQLGDVVGQSKQSPFTASRGFVRRGGVVTMLAADFYGPTSINDSGLVAGIALFQSQTRAVIYDTGSNTLTPLPAPGTASILRSEGYDIDASGRVVGHALISLTPTSSRDLAFLYENGETLDLNALIPANSGWELQYAFAINNAGQIVGLGKYQNQTGHYFLLTLANEPPTVTLGGPLSVDEGSALTLTATATDPEGSTLVYEWDLDGEPGYEVTGQGSAVVLDPAGDDGPATLMVGVRVTDAGGLKATASTTVEILNKPPTATLTASATTVYVNGAVTLALTNPFDPSVADTDAGFLYAWDCNNDGAFAAGGATHDCVFTDVTQTARARIADRNGGFTDYPVEVRVRTAQQGIADLIQTVLGFGLKAGMENSFLTKLTHAQDALAAGNPAAACGDLQAFINHARAQSGKALTAAQASQIIGEAEAIRAAIGCA